MSCSDVIPVVDFSACSLEECVIDVQHEAVLELSHKIHQALTTVGFLYLTNHGIKQEQVNGLNKVTKQFFTLPRDVKQKYRQKHGIYNGWVPYQAEGLNPESPSDLKETFDFTPAHVQVWPSEEVPALQPTLFNFRQQCEALAIRILELMALGLGMERTTFTKHHQRMCTDNVSSLRCLHYPPVSDKQDLHPKQQRCGEHTDYGSITLLFQDTMGGLEVFDKDCSWVPACPKDDTVLVNIGGLMERWTADKLCATLHRVVVPSSKVVQQHGRQSIAFFVQPDDNVLIEPLDGSQKYPPIKSIDYLRIRYDQSREGNYV